MQHTLLGLAFFGSHQVMQVIHSEGASRQPDEKPKAQDREAIGPVRPVAPATA